MYGGRQGGFYLTLLGSSFKDTGVVKLRRMSDNLRLVCQTPASGEGNVTGAYYKRDGTFIRVSHKLD